MAQNIYDSPTFFTGYSTLPRSRNGLDGMPEWASLRALIPTFTAERAPHVLELGCGYGWLARWAVSPASTGGLGAASVTGVEISEMMITRAKELTREQEQSSNSGISLPIVYVKEDLENVVLRELPWEGGQGSSDARYGLVVSQLTLHYITTAGVERLLSQVFKALLPGGKFVFSMEHPIFTAPTTVDPQWVDVPASSEGDSTIKKKAWPLEGYGREGQRTRDWFSTNVVKQHRMLGTWVGLFVAAGFQIEVLEEWVPSKEQLEKDIGQSGGFGELLERPMFLLVRIGKPDN
jgi:SAM-dependent methyltransferase